MLFSVTKLAIILASIQACVYGAPPTSTLQRRDDDCNGGDIINQSSAGSPLVFDCQVLADSMQNDAETQLITAADGFETLWALGTCGFGASTKNVGLAKIGNDNAVDLIRASIAMFAAPNPGQNFVGAKGTMGCQITGLTNEIASVKWAIFHT